MRPRPGSRTARARAQIAVVGRSALAGGACLLGGREIVVMNARASSHVSSSTYSTGTAGIATTATGYSQVSSLPAPARAVPAAVRAARAF